MTKSKSTKKALLASVMSLTLSAAMMVGTTFAWFTDSASAAVNRIQAGTLDVALVDAEGASLEGKTLEFKKAPEAAANETILWEPGCTYELPEVYVQNNGTLALKYKVVITGIDGDAKLNEAIEWTNSGLDMEQEYSLAAGEKSAAIAIKGQMLETAGNEYQGLSMDGIAITVVATQDAVEYDSTGNQYDASAAYPELKTASTAASFQDALANINQAGSQNVAITVTQDIEDIKGIQTAKGNDLAVDFGGNTVTVAEPVGSKGTETNGMQLLEGSDVVLKNGIYQPANDSVLMLIQNYSDLTLDGVTLDARNYSNCDYVLSNNCGYIVITGETNILAASGNVAFDSCKFGNYAIPTVVIDEKMTGTIDGKIEMTGGNLIIKGGVFKNTGMDFDTFQTYVADGYQATEANGVYTVTAK